MLETGSLKAVGTAKEPIIFTGAQKTAGYWEGINFYFSNNVKNELEYINAEYGGGASNWYGTIHIDCSVSSPTRVTIKEGSTLLFTKDTKLSVNTQGALKAIGTASKPILFTSEQKTAGYWKGIYFAYSNNVKNELANIVVEYAGGGYGWYGNIHVTSSNSNPTRLSIKNSTISHGIKHGIWLDKGSIVNSDIKTSNTFIDNVQADIGRPN